jgi:dihydropteroate synthase
MNNLSSTLAGRVEFKWGTRTYVMGIINITPDSFSGDGLSDKETAVEQALRMESEGADILDVGGESTRPGFTAIDPDEELRRVIPVIQAIVPRLKIPVSIDSYKYAVVRQALETGASIINDQWGLKSDPRLADLAVKYRVPIVLMSNQRDIGSFDASLKRDTASYRDSLVEIIGSLRQSIQIASTAGVPPQNIIVDPGLGFGKTWQYDLEIIRRLDELKVLEKPVLVGPSRKSFIKMILDVPPSERVEGTAAAVSVSIAKGADIVRVHDVKAIHRVCKVTDAIIRGV